MNHFWQNLASFTPRERRGAAFFIIILLALFGSKSLIPEFISKKPWYTVEDTALINKWSSQLKRSTILKPKPFNPNKVDARELALMGIPSSVARSWIRYLDAGGKFDNKYDLINLYGMPDSLYLRLEPYLIIPRQEKNQKYKYTKQYEKSSNSTRPKYTLKPFNPNNDSKEKLVKSGIQENIASNIVNFRKAGGGFYQKKDLMKLYSIDSSYYQKISQYVKIEHSQDNTVMVDSVEINSVTLTELVQLKIAKYKAKSILKYRNLLGGFFTYQQLNEVYNLDQGTIDKLKNSSWIDSILIEPIEINNADKQTLAKHPYITWKAAKQIIKYRNFAEKIENIEELRTLNVLKPSEISKLQPYLTFE